MARISKAARPKRLTNKVKAKKVPSLLGPFRAVLSWPMYTWIRIPKKYRYDGQGIILGTGAVVWTHKQGIYGVDRRCIRALETASIPFKRLENVVKELER